MHGIERRCRTRVAFAVTLVLAGLVTPALASARSKSAIARRPSAPKSSTGRPSSSAVVGVTIQPYAPLGVDPEANVPAATTVAAVRGTAIGVYATPTDARPKWTLDNQTNFSGRHVFVVLASQGDWLKVEVPVRPNGTVGFVRTSDVTLSSHDFAIVVSLSAKRLTLYKSGQAVLQESVGVGKASTPTPVGTFFLRELAQTRNPRGSYGPYAFGLSGYSNVLDRFGRGDGQIGLHGTNRPDLLGTPVSHGCIRIRNETITRLARTLPQGVPIDVRL